MPDIIAEIEGNHARMTINRPLARNAVRTETMDEMLSFLLSIEDRTDIGAVIIEGAGEHFVAGGDLNIFAERAELPASARAMAFEAMVHRMNPLFMVMERIPQIIVASLRGYVAGSGVCFAAAADLAIASTTAKFMLSHVKIGAPPDAGASYFLPRQVGMKRAKEIVLLGDTLNAQEAWRIGLVNRVVPDEDLDSEVLALAQRLGNGPRLAQAQAKLALNASFDNTLAEQLWLEAKGSNRITRTADFVEGPTSFIEKRKPDFQGR